MRRPNLLPLAIIVLILWTAMPPFAVAQSESGEMADRSTRNVVAVVPRHWPPQYQVDRNGNPVGFAIDVMDEIAARAGLTVTYVIAENFSTAVDTLTRGDADLIPNSGILSDRMSEFAFTAPVETFVVSLFVREDSDSIAGVADLPGQKLAVVDKNVGLFMFGERQDIDISIYPDVRSALLELIAGHVDALVYPQPTIQHLVHEAGIEDRIKVVGRPLKEVKRGIRVMKDEVTLLAILNAAVEDFVGTSDYQQIYTKWYTNPSPFWTAVRATWIMGALTLLVLLSMAWWRYQSVLALNRDLGKIIEEREEAEEALRESEERFRAVVNNSPAKIHIKDVRGRYTLVNWHAEKLFGVTDEEARGKTTDEIFPPKVAAAFTGHDRAVLETGQAVEQEEEWPGEDGIHTYLTVKFPILNASGRINGVAAIGTDITERKRTERALELAQFALDNAGDAALGLNRDGRIVYANNTICDLLGYSHEEVLTLSVPDYDPNASLEDFTRAWEQVKTTRPYVFETTYLTKAGKNIPVEVSLCFLKFGGEELVVGFARNITERRQAEEDRSLALMEAEQANRAKSEFLAAMSHELRTPLNAILGFSEVMKNQTLGPIGNIKYHDYAGDIHNSGQHLLELINDILDLSKVESGTDCINEETIEVSEVVDSALRLVRHRAEENSITLESDFPGHLPKLRADERKLKQMLVNLLSNAIKFTEAGGKVTVRISCGAESGCTFEVIDTGIGIRPVDIPKALSQFGQVGRDLEQAREGTGLGLPLTKALIELHGGTLKLHSEFGKGTTVTLWFPAERIVPPDHENARSA